MSVQAGSNGGGDVGAAAFAKLLTGQQSDGGTYMEPLPLLWIPAAFPPWLFILQSSLIGGRVLQTLGLGSNGVGQV